MPNEQEEKQEEREEKLDYFPFHVSDFIGDDIVDDMTHEELGIYIRLLCRAWQRTPVASLPIEDDKLMRLARVHSLKSWQELKPRVLAPFTLDVKLGYYTQKRLRSEYEKILKMKEKKAEAGRRGGLNRWKHSTLVDESTAIAQPRHSLDTAIAEPRHNHDFAQAIKTKTKTKKEKPPYPLTNSVAENNSVSSKSDAALSSVLLEENSVITVEENTEATPLTRPTSAPVAVTKQQQIKLDADWVFARWQAVMSQPNSRCTPGRRSKVETRLRSGYTREYIELAIIGCSTSDFHMSNGHNDLTLICRSDEKLEENYRRVEIYKRAHNGMLPAEVAEAKALANQSRVQGERHADLLALTAIDNCSYCKSEREGEVKQDFSPYRCPFHNPNEIALNKLKQVLSKAIQKATTPEDIAKATAQFEVQKTLLERQSTTEFPIIAVKAEMVAQAIVKRVLEGVTVEVIEARAQEQKEVAENETSIESPRLDM